MKQILTSVLVLLSIQTLHGKATPLEIVAATLIFEAGGEKVAGAMEAVHEVIINRSLSRHITQAQVCLQPKQFSCWNGKNLETTVAKARQHPKWIMALQLANQVKSRNLTKRADHYHSIHCNPSWSKRLTQTTQIGAHIFYR
jgi:spore germination cell wall hydrolase CwlJ-like protein